jgi:hypothetical protein
LPICLKHKCSKRPLIYNYLFLALHSCVNGTLCRSYWVVMVCGSKDFGQVLSNRSPNISIFAVLRFRFLLFFRYHWKPNTFFVFFPQIFILFFEDRLGTIFRYEHCRITQRNVSWLFYVFLTRWHHNILSYWFI